MSKIKIWIDGNEWESFFPDFECLSDDELSWMLNEDGIISTTAAIQWARDYEQMFMEQLLNTRWGEDDDPQLEEYAAWEKRLEDNPL